MVTNQCCGGQLVGFSPFRTAVFGAQATHTIVSTVSPKRDGSAKQSKPRAAAMPFHPILGTTQIYVGCYYIFLFGQPIPTTPEGNNAFTVKPRVRFDRWPVCNFSERCACSPRYSSSCYYAYAAILLKFANVGYWSKWLDGALSRASAECIHYSIMPGLGWWAGTLQYIYVCMLI